MALQAALAPHEPNQEQNQRSSVEQNSECRAITAAHLPATAVHAGVPLLWNQFHLVELKRMGAVHAQWRIVASVEGNPLAGITARAGHVHAAGERI
jgi:hypothetical protein